MRTLVLAALAAMMALSMTSFSSPARAQARVIPWCARTTFNYYGDCMYYTYAQCRAAISGLPGECIRNPYAAYGYRYGPDPWPRRRHAY